MRVLLTGATGFLGSRLLAALLEDGHRVTILARHGSSLQRIAHLLEMVEGVESAADETTLARRGIETVVHCATNYGRGGTDGSGIVQANLLFPLRLLEGAARAGVRSFINTDTTLAPEVSPYALSKAQFRAWLARFAGTADCVNVALEHFYGAHNDPSNFVTFLVQRLVANAPTLELTRGEQRRDFVHVDDVVAAYRVILAAHASASPGYRHYEVGSGCSISIRRLVELVKEQAGNTVTRLDFGAVPYRPHEAMESSADLTALTALGWQPAVPLEEGVRMLIDSERERMTA